MFPWGLEDSLTRSSWGWQGVGKRRKTTGAVAAAVRHVRKGDMQKSL